MIFSRFSRRKQHIIKYYNITTKNIDFFHSALCTPSIVYFVFDHNYFMLIHGLVVGTLPVFDDRLKITRALGDLSTLVIWCSYGISLIPDMTIYFMIYEIFIVVSSLFSYRQSTICFYDTPSAIMYERMCLVGANFSMLSLVLYDKFFIYLYE